MRRWLPVQLDLFQGLTQIGTRLFKQGI